jgi:hypothetical protein
VRAVGRACWARCWRPSTASRRARERVPRPPWIWSRLRSSGLFKLARADTGISATYLANGLEVSKFFFRAELQLPRGGLIVCIRPPHHLLRGSNCRRVSCDDLLHRSVCIGGTHLCRCSLSTSL